MAVSRSVRARPSLAHAGEPLYREIRAVLESARASAYRAVNAAMVRAYWQVGQLMIRRYKPAQNAAVLLDVRNSRRSASRIAFDATRGSDAAVRDAGTSPHTP
jgi:hypothetical protein